MIIEELAESYVMIAEELHSATLVGYPAPKVASVGDWMRHPAPGDFVVVTFVRRDTPATERVGTWMGSWSHLGPVSDEEREWHEETGEPEPLYAGWEEVFCLELLDGRLFSWSNADMIRVPRDRAEREDMWRSTDYHVAWDRRPW